MPRPAADALSANFVSCPTCGGPLRSVTDSRPAEFHEMNVIRRRRSCENCGQRAWTLEVPETHISDLRRLIAKEILLRMVEEMTK